MSSLRVHLFGSVRVAHKGSPTPARLTRTLQTLLTYLLLHSERSYPREVLAGLFWGDQPEPRARACLNTALWRLRAVLEPEGIPRGTYLVTSPLGAVGFNRDSDYWLDVAVFEEQVKRALSRQPAELDEGESARLAEALNLYTGDVLEACFDDWALRERGRLAALYVGGLEHLMRYHACRGELDAAIEAGQRLLARDASREDVHRGLMRLHDELGRRPQAIHQYHLCRQALARELGIEPSAETTALYATLVSDAGEVPTPGLGVLGPLVAALGRLTGAIEDVRLAHAELERTVERLSGDARTEHAAREPAEIPR